MSFASAMLNSILESIKREEENKNIKIKKVKKIYLEIGELTFINLEQLKFAFEVIAENTICKNAEIIAKYIKPKCKCLKCGYEGEPVVEDILVYCPKCKSISLKLTGGKDFNISKVEIDYETNTSN